MNKRKGVIMKLLSIAFMCCAAVIKWLFYGKFYFIILQHSYLFCFAFFSEIIFSLKFGLVLCTYSRCRTLFFFSFNFHVNFTLTRTKPIHSISLLQNLHCCPFSNLEKREKEKSREEKKKMNGIELVFIDFQFFVSFSAFVASALSSIQFQLQLQLQHQNK